MSRIRNACPAFRLLEAVTAEEVITTLGELEETVGDETSGLVADVAALETAVGGAEAGLVADVAALNTAVGDETSGLVADVAALNTAVGDETSGLVKDVADLETMVGAPTLVGATLDETKKTIDIEMSVVIFNAISFDPIGMKSNITIATDGTMFGELAAGDSINMSGRILRVNIDAGLTLATNKIKIAAGTLISVAGVENAEIVTDAIDASTP